MSFASLTFFLFLPLVFGLHWAGRGRRWQNAVLLAASYAFYAWWDWRFCILMLGSSLIDYAAGARLAERSSGAFRRAVLIAALGGNLAILGFFKYFDFFVESVLIAAATAGFDLSGPGLRVILPVGVSFYTFQTMSYTIDVYRGRFAPQRNLLDYLAFVSFFPQLVAGPIERAAKLLPQFRQARVFDGAEATGGCRFILWGLGKKLVLADNLAPIVNAAYGSAATASPAQLALATFCFAFQIYCDFSAYSDIAVGVARLFGIRLSRNFATPCFARSASDFWRRWHISLSSWFRDYVYIPLGGSRGAPSRTARNLLVTALISGLWHGAAWHFVAWGAFHGLWLVAGHAWRGWRPSDRAASGTRAGVVGSGPAGALTPFVLGRMCRTFALVCAGWVLFRAESLGDAGRVYAALATGWLELSAWRELAGLIVANGPLLALVAVFVITEWRTRFRWNPLAIEDFPVAARWAVYSALFWMVLVLGSRRGAEFIYFQF
ncbi:MAG: MBOAT family protein [Verrucomicrobiales bacterium]|nr:MBOAT family protein [Verrucomicrobiales bacterium]MCP5528594.1 MBOAT family protein [Verrucomicrobiales bacterium]